MSIFHVLPPDSRRMSLLCRVCWTTFEFSGGMAIASSQRLTPEKRRPAPGELGTRIQLGTTDRHGYQMASIRLRPAEPWAEEPASAGGHSSGAL